MPNEAQLALIVSGISLCISFLSMVAATIAAYYYWQELRGNRRDLRLKVEFRLESSVGTAFFVTLVNHSRRPTKINAAAVTLRPGQTLVPRGNHVNLLLGEADQITLEFPLTGHKTPYDPRDFREVEIRDTLGNAYRFPSRSIGSRLRSCRLKAQIRREYSPDPRPRTGPPLMY